MHWINRIVSSVMDLVLAPFGSLDPVWGLTAVSLLSGLLFLMVFKWTSDQDAIFRCKQEVKAHLLELRLFASDMVLTLRAQRDLLMANLRYLRHTFKPMLFLLVPVILLLVQLDARYGRRPLEVGDTTLLRLSLAANAPEDTRPRLELPEGVTLDGPPLRIPSLRETNWRLRVDAPGTHKVRVLVDGQEVEKLLHAGEGVVAISDQIHQSSLSSMGQAAERPLSTGSTVQSIALDHRSRDLRVLGWSVHWLLFFFVVSVVPAYLLKGMFGVEV
jgi:uncharacterized membrane protein (DUF106 family)